MSLSELIQERKTCLPYMHSLNIHELLLDHITSISPRLKVYAHSHMSSSLIQVYLSLTKTLVGIENGSYLTSDALPIQPQRLLC